MYRNTLEMSNFERLMVCVWRWRFWFAAGLLQKLVRMHLSARSVGTSANARAYSRTSSVRKVESLLVHMSEKAGFILFIMNTHRLSPGYPLPPIRR